MLATIGIVLVIYFAGMLAIGWMGRKHSKTFDSYLRMGKSGGVILLTGGYIGAHIGNGFVVGGASDGAAMGLAGGVYGIACAVSCLMVAFCLNDFIYKHDYLTLSDFYRERYDSQVPGVIYDLSQSLSCIGVFGGQIMAGKALFEALGFNGALGAVVIVAVVLLYSQLSGLWGAYATSVVQTVIIVVGLVLTTFVLFQNGAYGFLKNAVATGAASPTSLNFKGMDFEALVFMTVPLMLGQVTNQNNFLRITSAKSARVSKIACIVAFVVMTPLALMPAFIGSYGAAAYGASGSSAFFTVILNELNPIIAALIIAAALAAVMSTIDGGLIMLSAVLVRDIWTIVLNKKANEKQLKTFSNVVNLGACVIALVLSLTFDSMLRLFSNCYAFLAAACFVPFVGGALWKRGTTKGAVASSFVGMAIVVAIWFGLKVPMAGVFPIVPAAITYVVVSLMTADKKASNA